MTQNITLRLEKDLIRKAKALAAQRGTSVSGLLSDYLKRIVGQRDAYDAAKKRALERLRQGWDFGGRVTWRREELYDRPSRVHDE